MTTRTIPEIEERNKPIAPRQLGDRMAGLGDKVSDEQHIQVRFSLIQMIPTIGRNAFILWCYLARYVNRVNGNQNYGYAFPSYKRIIEELGWNDRTAIAKAIQTLQNHNLLVVRKTDGETNKYELHHPVSLPF